MSGYASGRPTVLDELATSSAERAEVLRKNSDLDELFQEALLHEKRDFAAALRSPGLSVVSEIHNKRVLLPLAIALGLLAGADRDPRAAGLEAHDRPRGHRRRRRQRRRR